jgi:hypothetical protein
MVFVDGLKGDGLDAYEFNNITKIFYLENLIKIYNLLKH